MRLLACVQLQKFREEFQLMDTSHTGRLCRRDFIAALDNAAQDREVDLRAVFDIIAVERRYHHVQSSKHQQSKGQDFSVSDLSYHEYVAAAMHGRVTVSEARLLLVCSYLDPEHRGAISIASLQSALGEEVPEEELHAMLAAADFDRDGLITKE